MQETAKSLENHPNESEIRSAFKRIYPWIAISISAAFLFYKYILQVSPSIMTSSLMRAFHVQGVGLGNLVATFFYSYMITQIFVGVLLDKYSTRFLGAIAIAISATGAMLFGMAHTLFMAELSRAMMGIGAAFATVSYMKIAAMWFRPNQFAFVSGLLATAAMLGAVFGEAPLSLVVDLEGWRQSLFLCSGIGFVIAILFVLFIRDKHTPQSGLPHHLDEKDPITFKTVLGVLSSKQNWLLTFYSGMSFSPVAVFGGLWGNPYLEQVHHLTRTQAATLISVVFIGLAIGGPILGLTSDFLKKRRGVMMFGTILSLICITSAIYITVLPIWSVIILLFFFGFGTGAFMLGFAIGKEINNIALAATVIALINTGDALFGAISEPLVGKMLDSGWTGQIIEGAHHFSIQDYHHAFLLLPFYLIMATILVFFIRESSHPAE